MPKALVVDDSRAVRMILSKTLRELGYEICEAANGCEALEVMEAERDSVTLVLADGRRVHEVFIAGRGEIVKIGTRLVSRPEDLDFRVADIADVISEVK